MWYLNPLQVDIAKAIESDPNRPDRLRKAQLEKKIKIVDAQIEGLKHKIQFKIKQIQKAVEEKVDSTRIVDYVQFKKCYISRLKRHQTYKNQLISDLENIILDQNI